MTVQNLKDRMKGAADGGFTLIEVLIVLAIIIVMVLVLIIAINPGQKLAETRDAGRFSSVTQLGRAMQAYSTANSSQYPAGGDKTWMPALVTAAEISSPIGLVTNSVNSVCAPAASEVNGWCYLVNGDTPPTEISVYSRLEANRYIVAKCTTEYGFTAPAAYAFWSSTEGRTGLVCVASGGNPAWDTVITE